MRPQNDVSAHRPQRRRRGRLALFVPIGLLAVLLGWYTSVRWIRRNFHEVVPAQVYRSAQPSEARLAEWAQRYGLKSVLCLRGSEGPWQSERRAGEALGLTMVRLPLHAVREPTVAELEELVGLLQTLPSPVLIHCQQGADRTGLASVLAAMCIGGQDYDTARRQLDWRRLHLSHGPIEIDEFFRRYEAWCDATGRPRGGWEQFWTWVRTEYPRANPAATAPSP